MKFTPLALPGVFLIELELHTDERGFFARQFCQHEMAQHGIAFDIKQANLSYNKYAGTLRGMHYQKDPFPEIKLVSCLQGSFFDVLVDLRPDSPTYLQHVQAELSEKNHRMLYVPPMIAHGFQTLENDTVVYYQLGEFFHPEAYDGVRWNDPKLNIQWPACKKRIINERDNNYALL